jgi:hypothetical protein
MKDGGGGNLGNDTVNALGVEDIPLPHTHMPRGCVHACVTICTTCMRVHQGCACATSGFSKPKEMLPSPPVVTVVVAAMETLLVMVVLLGGGTGLHSVIPSLYLKKNRDTARSFLAAFLHKPPPPTHLHQQCRYRPPYRPPPTTNTKR